MDKSKETKIKEYAKEIVQITDWVAKARQTKDVYIGRVAGNSAFLTMAREIIQNAIDEILKGNSIRPHFTVWYDENTKKITVEDNGRGIPHGMIGTIFGTDHTSSNYNKVAGSGNYSAGKNGCGASITNALSKLFTVDSFILGKGVHAEFHDGYLWDKGEVPIAADGRQGSIVSFIPDENEIGKVTATCGDVYGLIYMMMPATPIGTSVEFNGVDLKGRKHSEFFTNTEGILTHLKQLTSTPYIQEIGAYADNGTMKVDLMFTYDTQSQEDEERVISLNNTCPTNGGTHVDGAIDGICKWFKNYMNKIYLTKSKSKVVCTNNDVKTGLRLAISTFHLFASYNGQAKELLDNEDMFPFVSNTVMEALDNWSRAKPKDLEKMAKWFKQVIDLRMRMSKEKVKLSSSFTSSLFTGYPAKYIKPNSNKDVELIIVEGDSAFSSCRNARDPNTQGILPIRGKLPNAYIHPPEKILANEEIASIISICGAGYGKKFDINKCKISRLIIMTDADADGAHIRNLILATIALYMRPLLEHNMVYSATPPLYGLKLPGKKGKKATYQYFKTQEDFIEYVRNRFVKDYSISYIDGKPISKSDLTKLLVKNIDYISCVDRISRFYAIEPNFLEDLLINYTTASSINTFKKYINKKYPFAKVEYIKQYDTVMITGVVNRLVHNVAINGSFLAECIDIIQHLKESPNQYIVNSNVVSLYGLMSIFTNYIPSNIQRFKGLGEMSERMLKESTLNKDNRVLYRYSFEDIEKEIAYMRNLNDNKDILLTDIGY